MPEFPAPEVVYRSGRRLRGLAGRVRSSRACCSHFGGRPRRFPRPRASLSRFTIASTMSSCSVRSSARILFTSTVWLPSLGGTTRTAPRTLRIRRLHGCNPCGDQATVGVPSPSVAATYCTAVRPVNAIPFADGFRRFLRMCVNLPQIRHTKNPPQVSGMAPSSALRDCGFPFDATDGAKCLPDFAQESRSFASLTADFRPRLRFCLCERAMT